MKQIFASIQTEIKRKYADGIERYTAVSYVAAHMHQRSRDPAHSEACGAGAVVAVAVAVAAAAARTALLGGSSSCASSAQRF